MNKILLCLFFYIGTYSLIGQSVNISNTTLNTCDATIYDDGGPNGNYTENDYTMTVCANTGTDLYFVVNSLSLGSNVFGENDFLYIYEGVGTGGNLLFNSETDPINTILSTTNTCITINIQTNPHVFNTNVAAGFDITIS